ncbi:GbsR/MarR family transcriptional regulator [Pseudofrankia inefficax]|uniref:Regulatory protein MarR n=1 Tax=Pseudofrankia inefficax (strain DSM 45817 / CECT 9037 / DDB 130130 / EuI1c) TaxID=298654 RepID=E3J7Y8_PSEI1|nr:MarR family transcriptional regulator [Pseudofrankia inefficax]ADP82036.1 regulatory protein MarR [Pseudofrankia inefficax]
MNTQTDDRDPAEVRDFVERFAAALVDAGMPRMPSLVFVALLATDDARLNADELAARLGISRAAVSGAVQYLTHVGMIRRERQPGSRRDYYVLHDENWFEIVARREQILRHWATAADHGVAVLGADTPAGRRVAESRSFFEFLLAELPALLQRWRATRSQVTGQAPGS